MGDKSAHAVPSASARQRPENPKGKPGRPFVGARGGGFWGAGSLWVHSPRAKWVRVSHGGRAGPSTGGSLVRRVVDVIRGAQMAQLARRRSRGSRRGTTRACSKLECCASPTEIRKDCRHRRQEVAHGVSKRKKENAEAKKNAADPTQSDSPQLQVFSANSSCLCPTPRVSVQLHAFGQLYALAANSTLFRSTPPHINFWRCPLSRVRQRRRGKPPPPLNSPLPLPPPRSPLWKVNRGETGRILLPPENPGLA